jgi:hypothetical protein
MRLAFFIIFLVGGICFISCKKNNEDTPNGSNTDSLQQSIIYKTIATIPSPADSANGLLRDSMSVFRMKYKKEPDFISNIPNVFSNINKNFPGFSFGYDGPNNSITYFEFSAPAFPDVPRQFLLNTAYNHKSIRGTPYERPMYLGSSNGIDGMSYFVNNVYPPDAGMSSSTTYSSVTFNKLIKIPMPYSVDSAYFGSGRISGYCIDYFGLTETDTTKYVQRWDFTVDFTDLLIDP